MKRHEIREIFLGGPGSGHHGHRGIPGQRGGSAARGGFAGGATPTEWSDKIRAGASNKTDYPTGMAVLTKGLPSEFAKEIDVLRKDPTYTVTKAVNGVIVNKEEAVSPLLSTYLTKAVKESAPLEFKYKMAIRSAIRSEPDKQKVRDLIDEAEQKARIDPRPFWQALDKR